VVSAITTIIYLIFFLNIVSAFSKTWNSDLRMKSILNFIFFMEEFMENIEELGNLKIVLICYMKPFFLWINLWFIIYVIFNFLELTKKKITNKIFNSPYNQRTTHTNTNEKILKKNLIGSIFWRFIPRVNDLIDKLGGEMRFSKLENIFFYDLKWPRKRIGMK